MYTPLRRYELGKMLLNLVPILVGTNIASKLFTSAPMPIRILTGLLTLLIALSGFLVLPPSMKEKEKKKKGEKAQNG